MLESAPAGDEASKCKFHGSVFNLGYKIGSGFGGLSGVIISLNMNRARKFFNPLILTVLILCVVFAGGAGFYEAAKGTQNFFGKFTLTWGLTLIGLVGLGILAFVWAMITIWTPKRVDFFNRRLISFRDNAQWFGWLVGVGIALIPAKLFLYSPAGFFLTGVNFRLAVFITVTLLMGVLFTTEKGQLLTLKGALISMLLLGSIFGFALGFINVVDFPLSLTWSEGNRIWDYSILFGRELYNYPGDQPIFAYIDPGRQTLWGLPFLIPGVKIQGVRFWSAFVFTVPYAILGWAAFRYLPQKRNQWVLLGFWSFLFISQGPVYTPIILSGILIASARKKPLWAALPLIFLAGYYAHISRFTWMAAPVSWAILITLLDSGDQKDRSFIKNHWKKILLFGLAGYFGAFGITRGWDTIADRLGRAAIASAADQAIDVLKGTDFDSIDPVEDVGIPSQNTVLSDQPLLWERLWPNPTYGLGIVLGLLLAVGPLIILLIYLIRANVWRLNRIQKAGLFGILTGLLILGLVISTKIGGGGDLHNLDMFLISMVLTAGLAWEYGGSKMLSRLESVDPGMKLVLTLAVGIPAFMPWTDARPLELPPEDKTQWTLELLQSETSRVLQEGGEILFMDQRQLLTFGYLGDIPLVPEYEKKLVMDRAMSGSTKYFEPFYEDIANQRFDLIVTDPQRIRFSDEDEDWGAENDIWVQWVTKPLLCFYEPAFTIKKTGVWLLKPKTEPGECAFP